MPRRFELRSPTVNTSAETKTESVWAERLDLRAIAGRFGQQLQIDPEALAEMGVVFGDQMAIDARDPQALAELVDKRRQLFDQLPAEVRAIANNEAERFGEIVHTEEGLRALQDAGVPLGFDPEPIPEEVLEEPLPEDTNSSELEPAAQPATPNPPE
jgi:hypothetical protein